MVAQTLSFAALLLLTACGDKNTDEDDDTDIQDTDTDLEDTDTDLEDTDTDIDDGSLNNNPNGCPCHGWLYPSPGEEGHLAAARLVPPSWPYEVSSLSYPLAGDSSDDTDIEVHCQNGLAHRVEVWAGTDATPAATPANVQVLQVLATDQQTNDRTVEVSLNTPLLLQEGEYLFVGIELTGGYPETACLLMCQEVQEFADRNYWSNATSAPYSWARLSSYGIPGNIELEAQGQVAK